MQKEEGVYGRSLDQEVGTSEVEAGWEGSNIGDRLSSITNAPFTRSALQPLHLVMSQRS